MGDAVVVMGTDGAAVAARVTALRAEGRRAAGFVGNDRSTAEAMAAELFGEGATIEAVVPR